MFNVYMFTISFLPRKNRFLPKDKRNFSFRAKPFKKNKEKCGAFWGAKPHGCRFGAPGDRWRPGAAGDVALSALQRPRRAEEEGRRAAGGLGGSGGAGRVTRSAVKKKEPKGGGSGAWGAGGPHQFGKNVFFPNSWKLWGLSQTRPGALWGSHPARFREVPTFQVGVPSKGSGRFREVPSKGSKSRIQKVPRFK